MRKLVGVGLVVLGIAGIAIGWMMGQNVGVFHKAMLICYECIGIG